MSQEQDFRDLGPEEVFATAERLKGEGYRMVQICGVTGEGSTELIYSFDRDYMLLNLKVTVPFDTPVKSITPVYWAAFVYENEIHDLFGVDFEDSKLDYKGSFFRTGPKTPWRGADAKEGS